MTSFPDQLRLVLVPGADPEQGPLPPLLVALTVVTGLVDACSYLLLGHVFVANMTGNVVFLGFALAGASGFSINASLTALVCFWAGALAGGALGARLGAHRGRLLRGAVSLQAVCLAAAVVLTALATLPPSSGFRYPLIVTLSLGMGMQNATARRLAVPDLTTTVLTLTITGTAADSTLAGGRGSAAGRRLVALSAMFLGALAGALFVVHGHPVVPLAGALVLVAGVGVASHVCSRSTADLAWAHP